MKTENNEDVVFAEAAAELQAMTLTIPNEQVIAELQTIVERITFSGLDRQEYEKAKLMVYELFQGELSSPMLTFLHEMAIRHGLSLLGGRLGRGLLAYCVGHFRSDAEITFISAVHLNGPFKAMVRQQLHQVYPSVGKVVFQVVPGIGAGFAVKYGGQTYDMSLRRSAPELIRKFVAAGFADNIKRKAGQHG